MNDGRPATKTTIFHCAVLWQGGVRPSAWILLCGIIKVTEKSKAREKSFEGYNDGCWSSQVRQLWDEKWPRLDSYIKIYDPLKNKTIADYPKLLKQFAHNIHLSYEQNMAYY